MKKWPFRVTRLGIARREEIVVGRLRGIRRWAALVTLVALVVATAAGVTAAEAGAAVPVTAGGIQAQQPSVSGSRVVWSDYRAGQWDIWLYDAAVKRARKLTTGPGDKVQPAISGDTVVYVAYSVTTKGDIFAYDIPSKTTRLVSVDWQGLPSTGDQLNPTIGGAWVAWEDHSSAYNNGKINALNLVSGATVPVAASTTYQYRRPKIGGTVLTYERVLEKNIDGYVRGQSDVLYADLGAAPAAGPIQSAPLAETPADERLASTEGDWAAWMEFTAANGFDIKAKNLRTGETKWVVASPGEQAVPVVAGGVVYWIDATRGVRIESMNLDTGAKAPFPYRTRTDIAGLTGSGNALAWLQPIDGRWSVKVLLGAPVPGFDLAGLLAVKPAWSAFRFATTSSGGDVVAPRIVSSNVEPGETAVDPDDPLLVTFSETMDARSVNSDSVQLVDSVTGDPVEAEVAYSPLAKTATIDPAEKLDGSYVLKVSSAVSDRAGNAAADTFAVSFATAGAEFVAAVAPSRVAAPTVRIVSETGQVNLAWTATADGDGDLVGYQVKRFTTPSLDPATFSAAATLTPVSGPMTIASTSATFAPAADELDRTSTYYYAVVGIDAAGNFSQTWYNISPNPHATEINGMNTNSCLRCHSIHGAASGGLLGARAATGCYKCHGATDQATTYGYNSVNNVQADFFDYPYTNLNPSPPSEPSRHGNSYLRANVDNNQCVMCHAPHKRSYNDSEAISYRKLLKRSQVATDASSTPVVYSTDAAPMGKALCYNCHGSGGDELTPGSAPYTNMYYYGGPQAFANTAGDHNQTSWDLVGTSAPAHGTQNVNDAARPLATGGSLPANACQICHAEHGSESASLLAYRRSGTTTQLADAGGLCVKCHSATAVAPDNAANNNAWNSRDVKAQFQKTGSRHPVSTAGSALMPQESAATPGLIDTQTDFTNLTSARTNIDLTTAAGSAQLTKATINPPSESYLFAHDGGSQTFDQYRPADNAWNANNYGQFDPPSNGSFNTATGSNTFAANGKVYVTRGGNSTTLPMIREYTPPAGTGTGTWVNTALTTAFNSGFNSGSDAAVNTASSAVYISQGGNTNVIDWWNYPNNSENSMTFSGGTLGIGSGLAYAPTSNRLYVIFRNNDATAGGTEGRLWYLSAPALKTGAQTFTNTSVQITRNTASVSDYNRLVHFRDGAGVDYLMMIGLDTTGANDTVIVSTLGGTPVLTNLNISPFGAALADGCDLEWDGVNGGFIYATRGGANSTMARIDIPAASAQTAGNWGAWQALTNTPQTQDAGAGIAFATADPPSYTSATDYNTAGTFLIDNATPAGGDTDWSRVGWAASLAANTNVTVTVKDSGGTDVPGFTNISGGTVDLSTLSVSSYPQLDFLFTLSTTNVLNTPLVNSVELYSSKLVSQVTGRTTCYNCHNTHYVAEGIAATAWQMSRVSDPLDTNGTYGGTSTSFCIRCHGSIGYNAGTGAIDIAAVTNSANTLIPYAVGMRAITAWPFFNGWNKSDFTNAGHYTVSATNGKALCENCHDPHASDFKSLTAWTRPSGATITGGNTGTRDNTTVSAVKEENLCYQCHGDGSTANKGKAAGAVNIYTAAQSTYRHTIAATDAHSSIEDAPDLLASRHAECADCHDPHSARPGVHTVKSAAAGAVLRGVTGIRPTAWPANWTSVGSGNWTTEKFDGAATDYESYLCFKCHTSYLDPTGYGTTAPMTISTNTNGSTYRQTDLALEFNPNNQSGHNVVGSAVFPKTTTASGLPYTFGAADLNLNTTLGWDDVNTNTNKMTCSDCHSYDGTGARGPHGSGSKFIVDAYAAGQTANWYTTTLTGWGTSNFLCRKCHMTMTSNVVHNNGNHSGYQCQRCHVRIPHGWKRPRLLRRANFDTMPYSDSTVTGLTAIEYQNYAGDVQEADCSDNCGRHSNAATTWP